MICNIKYPILRLLLNALNCWFDCRKEKAIENAKHIVVELEKHGEPAKAALAEAQKDLASLEQSDSTSLQESGQQLLETMKLPGSD